MTLGYKAKISWLVVIATITMLAIAMLTTKVYIMQQYQTAYTELSRHILSVRDDVFKIEVTNGQAYDAMSDALVGAERQVKLLQVSLQPENLSGIANVLLADPQIAKHADTLAVSVTTLVANLETILRLKISQQYSKHTITLLQQDLWQKMPDIDNRLHIIATDIDLPLATAVSPELTSSNSYQSLLVHTGLLTQIKQQLSDRYQQILNGNVRDDFSSQGYFWLSVVEQTKLNLMLCSLLLIVFLSAYSRIQSQQQARKEKQMQHSLTKSEKEKHLLALVAEHAEDGFVIADSNGIVSWVNKGFTTMSGYSLNEVTGLKLAEMLQGKDTAAEEVRKIARAMSLHDSVAAELVYYHKDGHTYWVDVSINPVADDDGKISHFIAVERDMTARKKMQDDLAQAVVKAEVSNKAKSTFLATMSHELRTPLNGILGMAQIIEPNLDNAEHRKQIQILLESGNHLTSLLNDILDFSKVEGGKLELENEVFKFASVLQPITSTYEPICNEKNISLLVENHIEAEQAFKGDKARIRQVIYNLLSNSVKFTQTGSVSLKCKQGVNAAGDQGVEITIKDTGIGIRQDRLASIFDPFTQAESSTTRQYGGTGLGLSIVKQLVELMNGSISISSKVGQGSSFVVFIAIERSNLKQQAAITHEAAPSNLPDSIHILIAEDNKINALVAKTFCQRLGHTADVAKNGLEATQMVQQKHYDLVVMDNHMPEMDGIEATEYIRQQLKLDIPVFACTADVFQEAHDNMLRAGANHVLTKPLQENSFRDALNQHAHIICKVHLAHDISQVDNSDNKVVALERHCEEALNMTEADIDFKQLTQLSQGDHQQVVVLLDSFKVFAEKAITQLIQAYDHDDVKEIHTLAHAIQNMATEYYAERLHGLAKEIEAVTANGVIPKLEFLQHLVNLLEVNIHQNQRFMARHNARAQQAKNAGR
ncbi:hybrid sensor histidine kinase/response regulator [Shewanella youngdeokensis]|uniref:histidine kinase n=1 Tax=Shewanella youngdeokensis TaxID=2999068 RepID=A0ABZ0K0L5_9GAMM|nr:ATP-binding protein [Shewanella sp. DAU334]